VQGTCEKNKEALDGVHEDMSLASRILEDTFSSPWPRGQGYILGFGLGLESQVLALALPSVSFLDSITVREVEWREWKGAWGQSP